MWHIVYSMVNRVESAEETRKVGKNEGTLLKYFTPLLDLLVFNGKTWPTTIPCMVTGEDNVTASDTSKLSAILHYRIMVHLVVL